MKRHKPLFCCLTFPECRPPPALELQYQPIRLRPCYTYDYTDNKYKCKRIFKLIYFKNNYKKS